VIAQAVAALQPSRSRRIWDHDWGAQRADSLAIHLLDRSTRHAGQDVDKIAAVGASHMTSTRYVVAPSLRRLDARSGLRSGRLRDTRGMKEAEVRQLSHWIAVCSTAWAMSR